MQRSPLCPTPSTSELTSTNSGDEPTPTPPASDAITRELFATNDRADPTTPGGASARCLPLPPGEAWGEGCPASGPEEELTEEDDDPW